jgi:penicillin-binding protein 2B
VGKPTSRNDAKTKCSKLVENNEEGRNFYPDEYVLGSYGIEQQYCSELGGFYGKKLTLKEQEISDPKIKVQDGSDIYLTIDKNLQKKAEDILKRAVEANTNGNKINGKGGPIDATLIVMETNTGKIVALANYPTSDPNSSNKNWEGFASVAGKPYEAGSVVKPITVATALQLFQDDIKDPDTGNRLGVTPNFSFTDYDKDGKKYQENNGVIKTVTNADKRSFANMGKIGLKEILVYSINTGISELTDKMGLGTKVGGIKIQEFWNDKFLLDSRPIATFASDGNSNFKSLSESLYCPICFANYGYGQGISITPMQLMRAYSPFANNGKILDPYLVEKIKFKDGSVLGKEDDKRYKESKQIISVETAQNITKYLTAAADLPNKSGKTLAQVPKYSVAGKSGTAQVARKTFDNKPCSYSCNQEKGIYDHTYIGYGPSSNPKYMVLIKMAEPNPGEQKNYASTTLTPFFKEMMQFAFEYKNIPTDR